MFFVLSGFLITRGMISSKLDWTFLRRFYLKRILRIWPLYYSAVTAAILLTLALRTGDNSLLVIADFYPFILNIQNWFFAFGSEQAYLGHFWSLGVEEQFYLLWPACFLLIPTKKRIPLLTSGILGVLLFRWWHLAANAPSQNSLLLHYSTLFRSDSLLFGALVAVVVDERPELRNLKNSFRYAAPLIIGCSVFLLSTWPVSPFGDIPTQSIGYTVIALGASACLLILQSRDCDASILSLSPVRYFGRISYGLYVFHMPMLYFSKIIINTDSTSGTLSGLVFLIIAVSLTTALSVLSYHFLEKPFLVMKSRV